MDDAIHFDSGFVGLIRMNLNGRKVAKRITEDRIIAAMPPGHRLIRINWKKGGKIHVADGFGRIRIIALQ